LILVLGLGFMGWRNGVIKVAFTLVGGIVGLVLAGRLWSDVAEVIPIDNESFAKIAAFVLILAVVMIAAAIGAKIVKAILKIVFLGWVDGLAGLGIGLLLGAIAATAVVSAAGIVPSDSVQEAVDESKFAQPLIENMDIVFALLPEEFDDVKDLVGKGKGLLDQASSLLEKSGQLQDLIEQSSGLLEAAGGMDALLEQASALTASDDSLIVGFNGLDDFGGDNMYAVFENADGDFLGPLEATVLPTGFAVMAVDGLEGAAHTMSWYVDGNDNGDCDDVLPADAKGTITIPVDAVKIGQGYLNGLNRNGEDICDNF
jgi:uncharacterized membrane protein required for colicin V production